MFRLVRMANDRKVKTDFIATNKVVCYATRHLTNEKATCQADQNFVNSYGEKTWENRA